LHGKQQGDDRLERHDEEHVVKIVAHGDAEVLLVQTGVCSDRRVVL
jgi:hypothetical protein